MNAPNSDDGSGGLTLGQRIRKIEDGVEATLSKVNELDARDRADLVRYQSLDRRVSDLESAQTWLWRTVGGIVLAAVIAAALAYG